MTTEHPSSAENASSWLPRVGLMVLVVGGLGYVITQVNQGRKPIQNDHEVLAPASDYTSNVYHPEDVGYVGSQACVTCHSDIAETYFHHPMARSARSVADDRFTSTERARVANVPGHQKVLSVRSQENQMTHYEQMFDASGDEIYSLGFPIDEVIGSGQRARAYLLQRDHLFFMSPLNWYAQSDEWDVAPSYQPDDPRRFSRRTREDCLACHVGLFAYYEDAKDTFPENPFFEERIGCERCHGPGREHIALHESLTDSTQSNADSKNDPIVNPANLDSFARDSICYQCHLSSAASVLHPEKRPTDFRPGMSLHEIWTVLDYGSDIDSAGRTKSVNHVQQMRDSRCFQESNGALGCVSCHDPHKIPDPIQRIDFYREKCLGCHDNADCAYPMFQRSAALNDCVQCHMPTRDSNNMSHVAQTDHRILAWPEEESAVDDNEEKSLEFFAPSEHVQSEEVLQRAEALAKFRTSSTLSEAELRELLNDLRIALDSFPDDEVLQHATAMSYWRIGDRASAMKILRSAAAIEFPSEPILDALLTVSYDLGDFKTALAAADRLLLIDRFDSRVHALRADLLWNLGESEQSLEAMQDAIELNPGSVLLWQWLATRAMDASDQTIAKRAQEMLARLNTAAVPDRMRADGQREQTQ